MRFEKKINECWTDNQKIKVLTIQGPSTAGKTYMSDIVNDLLLKNNKKFLKISLDNYYIPRPKNASVYDFDNPRALNWEAILQLIQGINNKDEYIYIYKYCFEGSRSVGPIKVKNSFPEYLIVEGIYSLYLFSEIFFDLKKYNPTTETEALFIKNENKFENLESLNILLTTCKSKLTKIRLERDSIQRDKDQCETLIRVEREVWPATLKWVYASGLKVDLTFWHGSFNELEISRFISHLNTFMGEDKIEPRDANLFVCGDCGESEIDDVVKKAVKHN